MIRIFFKIAIMVLVFSGILIPVLAQPLSDNLIQLEEIDLDLNSTLLEWYNAQSRLTASDTYFGAYVIQPVGNDL